MDKKIERKFRWNAVKEYLPSFKKPLSSKKGSPTMEYIIIIAVGVIFAGLVYSFVGGGTVKSLIEGKITNAIENGKTK